ncbi:unnamed protein product [Didymodactylos carnosus]|uniref:AAA+ ATPase domain-containing protein n=1 Tax=Didymodactylos carnosus TaxID=1234261 RepID=A0A814IHB3_9BILA|nr:unnamed protein product [Didymodactylos carnosus]CAF3794777.1 unnamed protein product [Didymodactylos carnosus]
MSNSTAIISSNKDGSIKKRCHLIKRQKSYRKTRSSVAQSTIHLNKILRSHKLTTNKNQNNYTEIVDDDDIDHVEINVDNEMNEKVNALPVLAAAFSTGYFIDINCKLLPETMLDELAHKTYEFVQQQGILSRSLVLHTLDDPFLSRYVNRVYVGDFENNHKPVNLRDGLDMNIVLYKVKYERPHQHNITIEGEHINIGRRWSLPHDEFECLWESLEYDLPIKSQLIQYVFTVVRFSKAKIDRRIIHCNQTILLYGPPGCGKTSLCKGLAQKVSIRMKELFKKFYFYEMNAGNLFSKWFSESSRNVSRFFDDVQLQCMDKNSFVIVLIDEVESLSAARSAALASNEPSDMLRVVNTLLTHLDRLKEFSNVLVVTTSNLIEAIDLAVLDRSDISQYIGPPSTRGIYNVFKACFIEMMEKYVIKPIIYIPEIYDNDISDKLSQQLKEKLIYLARESNGLSGRTLRKLPMLAFAHSLTMPVPVDQLIQAMKQCIEQKKETDNYVGEMSYNNNCR